VLVVGNYSGIVFLKIWPRGGAAHAQERGVEISRFKSRFILVHSTSEGPLILGSDFQF